MFFKAEDKVRLAKVEKMVDELLKLYGNVERLEKQNWELFDRLMARNWNQWVDSPAVAEKVVGKPHQEYVLSPSQDEAMIGEDLSDAELGK